MPSRRSFIAAIGLAGAAAGLPSWARATGKGILSASAVTQVFGNGARLVAVAIEYGVEIDGARLSARDFTVDGRTVTAVYTATTAYPDTRAARGHYVIVALDPHDAQASLAKQMGPPHGPGGPGGLRGPGGPGKAGSIPADADNPKFQPATANVVQTGELWATGGEQVPASAAAIVTDKSINLIVDDFRQLSFKSPRTGKTLAYNLFVPRAYDPAKSYPLVLFMHDAGSTSSDPRTTLLQGLGAICWASPDDQAERPCFVLAPQYGEIIADDDSHTSGALDTTIHLIEMLSQQYSIDPARRYATGQSGGCMMSIAMNIKYPDFFAASFLVAGQWDPALVAPMVHNRLWIIVSQDDDKAFPGENAITEALEADGARVSRAIWDGTWSANQFRFAFDAMDAGKTAINYVTLAAGTVIPPGESTQGAAGHMNTWRIAYTIKPIREWIFRQHR